MIGEEVKNNYFYFMYVNTFYTLKIKSVYDIYLSLTQNVDFNTYNFDVKKYTN